MTAELCRIDRLSGVGFWLALFLAFGLEVSVTFGSAPLPACMGFLDWRRRGEGIFKGIFCSDQCGVGGVLLGYIVDILC
jgi:hypothetical protein